jgi:hypothetical protein
LPVFAEPCLTGRQMVRLRKRGAPHHVIWVGATKRRRSERADAYLELATGALLSE